MRRFMLGIVAAAAMLAAPAAHANVIDWTQWQFNVNGYPGTSDGAMGATGVHYAGEIKDLLYNYPSWGPPGTFDGGTVGNAPPPAGGIIQLSNGYILDTVTFSNPVLNPVMAIWSLGSVPYPATIDFLGTAFVIEAGGPSAEYNGIGLLPIGGPGVLGIEGNGTIRFLGTYSSISFVTTPEYWYGFTVGQDVAGVPEPATWALFLLGFGAIGWTLRNRRDVAATA